MQRRFALAIALALTTITAFSVVTVGARTGVFGSDGESSAGAMVVEEAPATMAPAPTTAALVPAAPEPIIITEYVYIDEPAPAAANSRTQRAAPATSAGGLAPLSVSDQPAAAQPEQAPAQPAQDPAAPTEAPAPLPTEEPTPAPRHDDDDEDGEEDERGEDREDE